jgi:hypothetical protein
MILKAHLIFTLRELVFLLTFWLLRLMPKVLASAGFS